MYKYNNDATDRRGSRNEYKPLLSCIEASALLHVTILVMLVVMSLVMQRVVMWHFCSQINGHVILESISLLSNALVSSLLRWSGYVLQNLGRCVPPRDVLGFGERGMVK
ncbi:hypothetical protein BD410DRAFT_779639 [Rickenella mellea]|uniref:Uncharacterized protein n=1 Tax=Rickenella mellea TaxID=50990 RepID=A0A4R5XDX1_9AGAM|nr:hypothetical protein BD410DRAFT_779639 [Rickenella mellea]